MTNTELTNAAFLSQLQAILNNETQPKEVKAAVTTLIVSGVVMFPVYKPHEGPACKFHLGEVIVHRKGGEYVVTGLPTNHRLEATNEPCYAYVGKDGITWHREQKDMEEGDRFTSKYAGPDYPGRFGGGAMRGFGAVNTELAVS